MQKKIEKKLSQRYNKDSKILQLQYYLGQSCTSSSGNKIQTYSEANHLKISGIPVSHIYHLLECQWMNLKKLNIDFCKIGSNGVKILIKASMPSLKTFSIGQCNIGNEGMKHLSKSYWKHIDEIQIKQNFIGFQGHLLITNMICPELKNLLTNKQSNEQNNWIDALSMITLQSNEFNPSMRTYKQQIKKQIEQIFKNKRILNKK